MQNNVKWAMIHHSAISYDKNPNQFEANNRVHKKWGIKSSFGYYLGYNYEISKCGIVRQARREGERTVACWQQGMNNGKAIHICLDGNFTIQMPTEKQKKSLTKLLKELKLKYPDIKILRHKDIANTLCPGNITTDYLSNLINKNMKLAKQGEHIYLIDEAGKFAWSIPEPKHQEEIIKHFKRCSIELGEAKETDLTGYFIIHGSNQLGWREFLNF